MVKFIAHRGNTRGPKNHENQQDYLYAALAKGYMVEADVILYNEKLYLGHDEPQELLSDQLMSNTEVVFHAKNLEALTALMDKNLHCFWHQVDRVTITSQGFIWCYPGVHPVHPKAIWLDLHDKPLPEVIDSTIYAVCGDYTRMLDD
jgi:hypothetical protein